MRGHLAFVRSNERFGALGRQAKKRFVERGENSSAGKAASLVFDIDKLVGADFERGLAALKVEAEKASKATAASNATN